MGAGACRTFRNVSEPPVFREAIVKRLSRKGGRPGWKGQGGPGRERGLTLLDVMISVAVLSIGILALNTMQVTAVKENVTAGNITGAVSAGKERLEFLRALPYDHELLRDLDTGKDLPANERAERLRRPLPPSPNPQIPDFRRYPPEHQARQGKYTVCWNVEDDLLEPGTKSVDIIVAWTEGATRRWVLLEHVIPEAF
jgi:hypothetical protein